MKIKIKKIQFEGEKGIWVILFFLSVASIISIYSSTCSLAYRNKEGNTEYYLIQQLGFLLLGWFLAYHTHKLKPSHISKLSQLGIFVIIPILLFTMIYGISSRWLPFPIINSFQPSELAKPILLIFIARLIANNQDTIKEFNTFKKVLTPIIITCSFIFIGNFSTTAILFSASILVLYVGRASMKHILLLGVVIIIFLGLLWITINKFPEVGRFGTWKSRIESFLSPDSNGHDSAWQKNQAKIAVYNGGLFGKGAGKSTQRFLLPQAHNDFIFSIIIEEYGIFAGLFILSLYFAILIMAIQISLKSKTVFRKLTVFGISFIISFQAMINMAVAVGLFPVTGQSLPLISLGGTSTVITLISFGIIQAISRSNTLDAIEQQKAELDEQGNINE